MKRMPFGEGIEKGTTFIRKSLTKMKIGSQKEASLPTSTCRIGERLRGRACKFFGLPEAAGKILEESHLNMSNVTLGA